jgi:hypothetical protein
LPKGDVADDAIMPTSSSGMFFISNQGANDVVQVQDTGLNTHDLYAGITNKNELVQIDPTTGKHTTLLTRSAVSARRKHPASHAVIA